LFARRVYTRAERAAFSVTMVAVALSFCGAGCSGMPYPASSEPGSLPVGVAASSVAIAPVSAPAGHWFVASHGNVTAHVFKYDGNVGRDPADVAAGWDRSFREVATALGAERTPSNVRVDGFLYPDAPSFMLTTGDTRAIEGFAIPWLRQFHVIDRDDAAVTAKHEMTHILSYLTFGHAGTTAMDEGLAVAVAGWSTSSLREQVADLRRDGELLPVSDLIAGFRSEPATVAYPEMGSFVRYLDERRGPATLARLYASTDPDSDFSRLYGESIAQAEQRWLETLAS